MKNTMKFIFSRKGLDSSFGNCASPIMPDGRLVWMPIPEDNPDKPGLQRFEDIPYQDITLGKIISDLSNGRIAGNQAVHIDPDIYDFYRPRKEGWRPLFGQTGAAESHLENRGVGVGDIFLFFGWFKRAVLDSGKYRYERKAEDLHIAYGWFQVGEVKKIRDIKEIEPWMEGHPHLLGSSYSDLDTLYIASEKLIVDGSDTGYNGAGYFPMLFPDIIFTAKGQTRSVWDMPRWLYPDNGKPALSYNEKPDKWHLMKDYVRLKIASRGQEFVLNVDYYPECIPWFLELLKQGSQQSHKI